MIDWNANRVRNYFDNNHLTRNPLYEQGFGSVADIHTTSHGDNRDGRTILECGLHVVGGKTIIRAS